MREFAQFLRFYPAYTKQTALDEYAITFFTLLNEGYRLESKHHLTLSKIILMPYYDKEARAKMLKSLEYASQHPDDILKPSDTAIDEAAVERALRG